ncbi:MAG: hypothetical protein IT462_06575 [Planctomycetes bacterium]|nr:hypothetical protein [Planctomycetota bacterium]
MKKLMIAAALSALCAVGASACFAEFPAHRVKLDRAAMQNPFPPTVYDTNHLVLKNFTLEASASGTGVKVKGEFWTDFEVEGGHKLEAGQMTGIKVDVSLLEMRSATEAGRMVPGQFVTSTVSRVEQDLGWGSFELPELAKPLPPGSYQILVMITFGVQDTKFREGLKWCPNWYGGWTQMDDDGKVIASGDVYGHETEHEKAYQGLLNSMKSVKDTGVLMVGAMRADSGALDFGRAGSETFLSQDQSYRVMGELINLVDQRKKADEDYKKEKPVLEKELKDAANAAAKAQAKQKLDKLEERYKIAKASTEAITALNGGAATKDEISEYARIGAIRTRLSEQISNWEDKLREKYWLLLDGYIWYKAYNAIATAGYNASEAIKLGNNTQDSEKRQAELKKRKDDAAYKATKDKEIEDKIGLSLMPDKLKTCASDYFRKMIENDDWDSSKFVIKQGPKYVLNIKAWRTHVISVATTCYNETKPILEELNTENNYCVQKWPDAYGSAKAARDAVLSLGFGYEFSIRTDAVMKESVDMVNGDLETLAATNPTIESYIKAAVGNVHSAFQSKIHSGLDTAKKGVKLHDFVKRWNKAKKPK